MAPLRPSWNNIRGRGFYLAIAMAVVSSLIGWGIQSLITAKVPGETHCYKEVCHRVFSLDETRKQVGQTFDLTATHYDAPGIDKFNTGQFTSSGEEFDAGNPARTSASNFPDGTELLLWHPVTRRASHVRVNDFGPFWGKRTIDVTRRVADDMGWSKEGVTQLKVTVIWAPPPGEPRYRRARVYPPSLGLIGVVDSTQHAALVRTLIANAHKRNGIKGPPLPEYEVEPPAFHAEPAEVAKAAEEQRDRDASMIIAGLTRSIVENTLASELQPGFAFTGPPGFRSEATADSPAVVAAVIASALDLIPQPLRSPSELPADLVPPTRVALALEPLPPADFERDERPSATYTVASSSVSTAGAGQVTGPPAPNQPSISPQAASGEKPVARVLAAAAPSTQSVVTIHAADLLSYAASPYLWLGIVLMLSMWGANARTRNRKIAAPVGASSLPIKADDPLAVGKRASAAAEADARIALAKSLANGAASPAELEAREALAQELARREAEAEALRARLREVDQAVRAPIHVNDISPTTKTAEPIEPPKPPAAPIESAQAREARLRQIAAADAARREREAHAAKLAAMPSTLAKDLAAAVLGLPGSEKFWGNVIISAATLKGTVRSGSALRIDGVVDGCVQAPVVMISHGATITGVVAAEHIVILGAVQGTVIGRKVTLTETAAVEGDMYYQSLSLDQHAHCDVRFSRLGPSTDIDAVAAEVVSDATRRAA